MNSYSPNEILEKELEFIKSYVPENLLKEYEKDQTFWNLSNEKIIKLIEEKADRTRWLTDNKVVYIQFQDENTKNFPDFTVSGLFYLVRVSDIVKNNLKIELRSVYLSDKKNPPLFVKNISNVKIIAETLSPQEIKIVQLYFIDVLRRYSSVNGNVEIKDNSIISNNYLIHCFRLLDSNQALKKDKLDEIGAVNLENFGVVKE